MLRGAQDLLYFTEVSIENSHLLYLSIFILLAIIFKMIFGLRNNLYLISNDTRLRDQSIIPLTHLKKRSSFINRNWREDVDLYLNDFQNNQYPLNIKYGVFRHFYLTYKGAYRDVLINGKRVSRNKKYYLRKGDILSVGGRRFRVLTTARNLSKTQVFSVSTRV